MQLRDVMTRDVVMCPPDATLVDAARRMRDEDVGALPVGENGRLQGMVTDRDIVVRAIAEERSPAETRVADVCSAEVVSCREDDSLEDAADIMAEHQIRRLPIVGDDQQLIGIVALADVALRDQEAGGSALGDISEPGVAERAA